MHTRIFNGWLNIDKPLGISSNVVVGRVRRLLNKIKVGHAGTLDPLADGVLPLALGEATKVVSYLVDAEKEYVFEVTWGEQRTTDDRAGEIMAVSAKRPTESEINLMLSAVTGSFFQMPPQYSAKKIQGKRACDIVRRNQGTVELAPVMIEVKKISLLEYERNKARFHVICSKGTYVRSLARDLGTMLGCLGYASKITRTRVGPFTKETAISIEKLEESVKMSIVPNVILPLQTVLDDIPAVLINASQAQKLQRGQAVAYVDATLGQALSLPYKSKCICLTADSVPVAMAQYIDGQLLPKRVFNFIHERNIDVDYTRTETRSD